MGSLTFRSGGAGSSRVGSAFALLLAGCNTPPAFQVSGRRHCGHGDLDHAGHGAERQFRGRRHRRRAIGSGVGSLFGGGSGGPLLLLLLLLLCTVVGLPPAAPRRQPDGAAGSSGASASADDSTVATVQPDHRAGTAHPAVACRSPTAASSCCRETVALMLALAAALVACMPRMKHRRRGPQQPQCTRLGRRYYEGTMPCADCPDIKTQLTLLKNGRLS